MNKIDIDLFSGPGGWCTAGRELGISFLGLEWDEAACQTRAAAGHATVRTDVAAFPVERLAKRLRGMGGSPPCRQFSAAGNRAGAQVIEILARAIVEACAGQPTRAVRRREMVTALRRSPWLADRPVTHPLGADLDLMAYIWRRDSQRAWKKKLLARKGNYRALQRDMANAPPGPHLTRAQRSAKIWAAVRDASLVIEPARFIAAGEPEWVALEQVPAVLPLWEVYAAELRKRGYSAWCGKLNAADYGVAQVRERAILIASRAHRVSRPEPTNYDPRKGMQLWGAPWVSMAEALGWGMTARPAPTATAGGVELGGYEPFARGGRECMFREQEAGRWARHIRAVTLAGAPAKVTARNQDHLMSPPPP